MPSVLMYLSSIVNEGNYSVSGRQKFLSVGSGQWAMGSRQWAVGHGPWWLPSYFGWRKGP